TSGSLAAGDTANFTESYGSKNVGTGKTLTAAGSVSDGNSGNNYAVTFISSTNGTILARQLDIYAASDSKVYDGTTSSGAAPTYIGLQAGDSLSVSQAFASRNVLGANGSTLVASYVLNDGNGGGNYAVTTHTASGSISQAALDIYATGDTKGYDGT